MYHQSAGGVMIYTATFNPALDYTMEVTRLTPGKVNRAQKTHITPGGKGINVSIVLKNLGMENKILGFIGGFTGNAIEESLKKLGHKTDFVHLKNGMTRINVKVLDSETTDINAEGPEISNSDLNSFYEKLNGMKKGDTLIISGAVPPTMPDYTYALVLEKLVSKGVRTVVDASGQLLLRTLVFKPFLIKPNIDELEELFSVHIDTKSEVIKYALELKKMGAENVLVSLGPAGAILAADDGRIYECAAPSGSPMSTVGAGDSMIAGFFYGLAEYADSEEEYAYALKMAVAAGSATVFSNDLARRDDILALANRLHVAENIQNQ